MEKKYVVVDGQVYHESEQIPDIGSWVAVSVNGNRRDYEGLSQDVEKLPHYVDSGSTALCLDTGDLYKYHKPTDRWWQTKRMGRPWKPAQTEADQRPCAF